MNNLLTPYDAARKLCISDRRLMTWVRRGDVPFIELPTGDVRFDEAALAEWVQQHIRRPVSEQ